MIVHLENDGDTYEVHLYGLGQEAKLVRMSDNDAISVPVFLTESEWAVLDRFLNHVIVVGEQGLP